jgi:hypothetical protein
MEALWFGIKMGFGIAVGLTIFLFAARLFNAVRAFFKRLPFTRAGFTYERYRAGVSGWVTRDPHNEDLILWDDEHNVTLRSTDESASWRATTETRKQCLNLGREYWNR